MNLWFHQRYRLCSRWRLKCLQKLFANGRIKRLVAVGIVGSDPCQESFKSSAVGYDGLDDDFAIHCTEITCLIIFLIWLVS